MYVVRDIKKVNEVDILFGKGSFLLFNNEFKLLLCARVVWSIVVEG